MVKTGLAVAAILLLSSASAMAVDRAAAKACAGDIKAQCADVKPGEGRIRACVKDHFKDLSPGCQEVLVKAEALRKACRADAKQFCADVKPGGGRIAACLTQHTAEVSDPCKDAMAQIAAGKN
jgi:hypothetical protein